MPTSMSARLSMSEPLSRPQQPEVSVRERELELREREVAVRERHAAALERVSASTSDLPFARRELARSSTLAPRDPPLQVRATPRREPAAAPRPKTRAEIAEMSARLARGLSTGGAAPRRSSTTKSPGQKSPPRAAKRLERLDSQSESQLVSPEAVVLAGDDRLSGVRTPPTQSPRAGLRDELAALRDAVAELQRKRVNPNPRLEHLQEEARALLDPPLGWTLPDLSLVSQEQIDQLALDNARLRLVLAKCLCA